MDLFTRLITAAIHSGGIAAPLLLLWRWRPAVLVWPVKIINNLAVRRPALCIITLCMLAPAIRLLEVPWLGIPEPRIHDEFNHLLVADTLTHGRLSNPVHPFRRHFETIYVLQEPSYASTYPPGNGMVLALGEIAGHPWIAICTCMGLMCGAIAWMLYGWVPPLWAVIGGLIITFRLGLTSYWMNSYWGGTVPAIGGALALGALPRLFTPTLSRKYAWALAAGWAMVWLTRPYESIFFGIGLFIAILWLRRAHRVPFRSVARRILAPLALVVFGLAGFSAYYNWRVTKDPLMMPYLLGQRMQGVPQGFCFQEQLPPSTFATQNMLGVYRWQLDARRSCDSAPTFIHQLKMHWRSLWAFYVSGFYTVPFLVALWAARRDLSLRIILAMLAIGLVGSALYAFLFPHYVAAYAAAAVLMIVCGLHVMSQWRWRSVPWGALTAATLVIWASWRSSLPSQAGLEYDLPPRANIEAQLRSTPGKDLVFVRYAAAHNFNSEWVFNEADIDSSEIVWARTIDASSDAALTNYFKDRTIWALEADASPPRLEPLRLPVRDVNTATSF